MIGLAGIFAHDLVHDANGLEHVLLRNRILAKLGRRGIKTIGCARNGNDAERLAKPVKVALLLNAELLARLAAVVSMNPDILVLDEPTNGLDEDSCDIVVNFLLAYVAAGKTVLMSTHHQDLVRRLGARAIYIDRYHHVVEAPVPSYGTEIAAAE